MMAVSYYDGLLLLCVAKFYLLLRLIYVFDDGQWLVDGIRLLFWTKA